MKKIILLVFACVLGRELTLAQIKLGIRAGVSSASYKANDFNPQNGERYIIDKSKNSEYGFHLGLIAQIGIRNIAIQPELLLSTISNKYKITDAQSQLNTVVTKNDRSYNLDFPIIVCYRIGILKLEAGPTGRVLIANKSQLEDYTGYKAKFNSATWAGQVGVGLELFGLTGDLKYEFPITKYGDGIAINGVEHKFDSRVRQVVLSVGFFF